MLSAFFLMIRLRSWVWERKVTAMKCQFHHIIPGLRVVTWLIIGDDGLDPLAEGVFISLSSLKLPSPTPHTMLFGGKSLRIATTEKSGGSTPPPWEQIISIMNKNGKVFVSYVPRTVIILCVMYFFLPHSGMVLLKSKPTNKRNKKPTNESISGIVIWEVITDLCYLVMFSYIWVDKCPRYIHHRI